MSAPPLTVVQEAPEAPPQTNATAAPQSAPEPAPVPAPSPDAAALPAAPEGPPRAHPVRAIVLPTVLGGLGAAVCFAAFRAKRTQEATRDPFLPIFLAAAGGALLAAAGFVYWRG